MVFADRYEGFDIHGLTRHFEKAIDKIEQEHNVTYTYLSIGVLRLLTYPSARI